MTTPSAAAAFADAVGRSLGDGGESRPLCRICADHLGSSGAVITLEAGRATTQLCASDRRSRQLDDLQYSLGEGPSIDARFQPLPVIAGDLSSADDTRRWPTFANAAIESGIRAMVVRPLYVGASRLGALTLYREDSGVPSATDDRDGEVTVGLLSKRILELQAGVAPGQLAEGLAEAGAYRAEIHQAAGMVSVQLDISVSDALVRLRSHAYSTGRRTSDVATDIVARRLRLAP